MIQANERVFFDDNGIFISQHRFATPDGSVYTTRSMQRVWGSVDKKPASGLYIGFAILLIFAAIMMMAFGPILILAWRDGEYLAGEYSLAWGYGMTALGVTILIGAIVFHIIYRTLTRRRYWANFTFAGGGVFSGSGSVSDYGNISTHSERKPDYSVWSYDADWSRNLIAAASEAMLASQA